jgi:hypothetical protein
MHQQGVRLLYFALFHPYCCLVLASIPSSSYFFFRNESLFLLAGLKVPNEPTWQARQNVYVAAAKKFLGRLKPEYENIPIVFVRNLRTNPRLFLIVECKLPSQ